MNWTIGKNAAGGLALAIVLLIFSAILAYYNIRTIAKNESLVVHTHHVLEVLNQVWSTLRDAESGQRGFIISDEPTYLPRFEIAREEIDRQIQRLEELTKDNPSQQIFVGELKQATHARLDTLAEGIEVQKARGWEGGRAFVRNGLGKSQMEAVQDLVETMIGEERRLLAERSTNAQVTYRTALFTTVLNTLVGLALVGIVYTLAIRDFAARAKMTAELERMVKVRTAELDHINAALKTSNNELEQFASVASHDLQEPLRKIEAFGDRLKTRCADALGEQGQEYLGRILSSASRMRALISDLLSFSRVSTRAQPPQVVHLQTTAEEVVSDLEGRLQQTSGRVELGRLPSLEGDPLQLRQLLQNLIGNALKFHRPGVPPVVRVEAEVGSAERTNGFFTLTVADNGIGFEEVYLDRIFNVFQRLHGREEFEGTGMGLAICRKIVERHGGTITARSTLGEGSQFIVTLPLVQPKKENAAA
jgi:signal transduction histidine kinase